MAAAVQIQKQVKPNAYPMLNSTQSEILKYNQSLVNGATVDKTTDDDSLKVENNAKSTPEIQKIREIIKRGKEERVQKTDRHRQRYEKQCAANGVEVPAKQNVPTSFLIYFNEHRKAYKIRYPCNKLLLCLTRYCSFKGE